MEERRKYKGHNPRKYADIDKIIRRRIREVKGKYVEAKCKENEEKKSKDDYLKTAESIIAANLSETPVLSRALADFGSEILICLLAVRGCGAEAMISIIKNLSSIPTRGAKAKHRRHAIVYRKTRGISWDSRLESRCGKEIEDDHEFLLKDDLQTLQR
ncbi:hypothetical protein ILUMI_23262 [Ignelater luminosus]|uniref:Uncharacterized protein n=1 Tax=Ignelater luminosus TaxID=2038154 RepID=A0A8K0C946_IGNLU|nr:hypothetical protein ILUMI_23262 [Ignelater luminosus]